MVADLVVDTPGRTRGTFGTVDAVSSEAVTVLVLQAFAVQGGAARASRRIRNPRARGSSANDQMEVGRRAGTRTSSRTMKKGIIG